MLRDLFQFNVIFTISILYKWSHDFITLSASLQSTSVDLVKCYNRVKKVVKKLSQQEHDKKLFEKIYDEAVLKSVAIGILDPNIDFRQQIPYDTAYSSPGEFYYKTIYMVYVKDLIVHFEKRFNKINKLIFNMQRLIPAFFNDDLDIIKAIHNHYADDLDGCSEDQFLSQYEYWKMEFESDDSAQPTTAPPTTALESIAKCREFEPAIKRALQILATLPVSTATAERSFSTLRMLKTYLRNTMGQERLTALALINIHKDQSIDIDEVISIFRQKSRRINI